MPRPSTILVAKATCALICLILLGQISLFILCRCRELPTQENLPRRRERLPDDYYQRRLKQLRDEVNRLKGTEQAQNSIIGDLQLKNRNLALEVSNLRKAEKVNQAQDLSRIKSRITEAEFLKNEPIKSEYEVIPFDAIAPNAIYQTASALSGNPAERPYGNKGKDYFEAVKFAVNVLNNEFENKDMRTSALDLVDGIMRVDRLYGTQYDLYFRTLELNVYRRIKILRPYGPLGLVGDVETLDVSDELINVILPLAGRVDKFRIFMENFIDVAVRWDGRVYLTVVLFGEDGKAEVKSLLENVTKAENFTAHKLVLTNETFSRGLGLQKGVLAWDRGNVLMFFCDVDVFFTAEFLERCRMYSSPGLKLYYPIVFSLYNPMLVYDGKPPSWDRQFRINQESGFWRSYGFGMTCQYRNDFLNTGGFDLSIKGWGKEDVKLYRQHLTSNLIVIRAVDRGIFHIWHHKHCNRTLSQEQFMACIKSKVRSEGSPTQLGLLAFGQKIFSEKEVNWIEELQASIHKRNPKPVVVSKGVSDGAEKKNEEQNNEKQTSKTPKRENNEKPGMTGQYNGQEKQKNKYFNLNQANPEESTPGSTLQS